MSTTFYGESIGARGPNGWEGARMSALDLSLWYQNTEGFFRRNVTEEQAVRSVSLPIFPNKVTGIMGPSGCGKSTLLKMFNRLHDLRLGKSDVRYKGRVIFNGDDINGHAVNLDLHRSKVGIVLQEPAPFPTSIYENVAFPIRLYCGKLSKSELDDRVAIYLKRAALWSEVKDKLDQNASKLSGGQKQRLCLARSLAAEPEVLLMDQPTSKLDVDSAELIDDLFIELKKDYTIVIVTHSGAQAAYVSDYIAFMYKGALLEFDDVNVIVNRPHTELASRYIRGRRLTDKKN